MKTITALFTLLITVIGTINTAQCQDNKGQFGFELNAGISHELSDIRFEVLKNQLNPDLLFRINRSFFVNIRSIDEMTAWSRSCIKLELKPKAYNGADTLEYIAFCRF